MTNCTTPEKQHQWKKTEQDQVITMQCEVCGIGTRLDMKSDAPMEYCSPETGGIWKPAESL